MPDAVSSEAGSSSIPSPVRSFLVQWQPHQLSDIIENQCRPSNGGIIVQVKLAYFAFVSLRGSRKGVVNEQHHTPKQFIT